MKGITAKFCNKVFEIEKDFLNHGHLDDFKEAVIVAQEEYLFEFSQSTKDIAEKIQYDRAINWLKTHISVSLKEKIKKYFDEHTINQDNHFVLFLTYNASVSAEIAEKAFKEFLVQ